MFYSKANKKQKNTRIRAKTIYVATILYHNLNRRNEGEESIRDGRALFT